jgi:chlorobactene glucosyltransferase
MKVCLSVIVVLLYLGWIALHVALNKWGRRWHLDTKMGCVAEDVSVRLVIPARNEAHNIANCLSAMSQLKLIGPFEIVVVDDNSEDGTQNVAQGFSEELPGLRVMAAEERPAEWAGKAWACYQGSRGATTDWICFVDADVVLSPSVLGQAIAVGERENLDLLSLFGRWEVMSFWERLLVPALGWFVRGASQIDAVNMGQAAFANGQFMLFRRDKYEQIGGHTAVKTSVLDDVGLAISMRQQGGKLGLRVAPTGFLVRPYSSLAEILEGYGKNLFEGMGRSYVLAILSAGFLFTCTVGPVLLFGLCLLTGQKTLSVATLGLIGLVMIYRYRLEKKDERRGAIWIALLHPLAGVWMTWIVLRSMVARSTTWKGRSFHRGQANPRLQ